MPMTVVPKTEEVYKNKGKMYVHRRIQQAIAEVGFIADGTLDPINFHFHFSIERRSIEPEKIKGTFRHHAEEAEDWQYHLLIQTIFERDVNIGRI